MSVRSKKTYTEDSIESLTPLEFTRLRPGVYVGSTEHSTQLAVEVVSNAIDEYNAGHGSQITITIDKDNTITVEDQGQGFIPNLTREDGKTVLEAAFSVLNTSGKYNDDGVYEGTALGLNGIGGKLVVFLSNWAKVTSWRDGKVEEVWFKEGIFEKRRTGAWTDKTRVSGTIVTWHPSKEFFSSIEINYTTFKELLQITSCLCPGLTIQLDNKGEKTTYYSTKGLNDLVDIAVGQDEIIKNRLIINYVNGKNKLNAVLTYTSSYSPTIVAYVNTGLTESGPHITQFKSILTRELNKFFHEKGWLKDKESLSGEDYQEGLYLVFNLTTSGVSYDAQTKSRIVKLDMKPFSQIIAEELQYWFAVNEKEIKKLADKALNAKKAREAAKKAREATRGVREKSNKKSLLDLPTKLVDSWSKKRLECELYITEGDSAANGLVKARDSERQAIFPIRGKMISSYKNSTEKIFKNQEIVNLIKALGLELDPRTGKLIYNTKKLRYGKIIAAADADPDGKAIKNLIFTNLWWLCPELILNGHVYAAIPPLFRITTSKNKYIYLNDEKDLARYKKSHPGEKYIISRNKGLGEQDSEELEISLLNYQTRNIVQLTVEDLAETEEMFEVLMGPEVSRRRQYLLEHSEEAESL